MSAPALYWWHTEQDLKVADGLSRARQILNTIPAPVHKLPPGALHEVVMSEDMVRLITSDFIAFVACLPRNNTRIQTLIMVAGNDGQLTKGMMETIRDVMQSGDIGGLLE